MDRYYTPSPPDNQQNLQHPASRLINDVWNIIVKTVFNSGRCLPSDDDSSSITSLSPRNDYFNVRVDQASSAEAAICAASQTTRQVTLPSQLKDIEHLWKTSDYAREHPNWPASPAPADFEIPANFLGNKPADWLSELEMFREELNQKLNLAMAIFIHEAKITRFNGRMEDLIKSFTPGEKARVVHAYIDTDLTDSSVARNQVYQKLKGMGWLVKAVNKTRKQVGMVGGC
ncbi:uncharacterized protein BDZ99DRAFT_530458 [Mytilinidion resinicola]|uniref:Uncharacterized protein n=1 Tax=Mytilinidion resinicola TaxID=574789 RepID=A0A6A6Z9S0_9PEZI|nr:uncharacterized protein BDZ99DRAFT_530458 [Mytilinidion resinicola]KAF2817558.1 hypothetical protein BDZ99DRAFT_530458 [Mytilinidion resinicola]